MITTQELKNLVTEWRLREDIIEKDYVIGWVLWGIGSDPDLNAHWAFKGGTSLKKCYIETWRFSEDLDFTVIPGGPDNPETIEPIIKRILERVHEESGIDFSIKPPTFKYFDKYLYTEGSIYYRGPRNATNPSRIKLDISGLEKIIRPTVLRQISHSYGDTLPEPANVRCYAFEEVFAEKLRAMGERGRPRDLYDIVLLFRRNFQQSEQKLIKFVLDEKCRTKGVPIPTFESIQNSENKAELISEWENMLGHQIQVLPSFEQFWKELPAIFNWLNGVSTPQKQAMIPAGKDEDSTWMPPQTIRQWGLSVPLESIRFAGVNHLTIELGYGGSVRLIEPYSLRRTKDDNLVLHAIKLPMGETRSYRVDKIESVKVTTKSFEPRYQIEFSPSGIIQAPAESRNVNNYGSIVKTLRPSGRSRANHFFNPKYVFQCGMCMKKFTKTTNNSTLRAHKNSFGMSCSGRIGYLIGNK